MQYSVQETEPVMSLAENWVMQLIPAILGAFARISVDTQKTYYADKDDNVPDWMEDIATAVRNKAGIDVPGDDTIGDTSLNIDNSPDKLDQWGQPVSTGSLPERLAENLILPGYLEKKDDSPESAAMLDFLKDNGVSYTGKYVLNEPPRTIDVYNPQKGISEESYLSSEEYAVMAEMVGTAQKDFIKDYLINDKMLEYDHKLYSVKSNNKSGKGSTDYTYKGKLEDATVPNGYVFEKGSFKSDANGKATQIIEQSDEAYRAWLYQKLLREAVDAAEAEALIKILEMREKE